MFDEIVELWVVLAESVICINDSKFGVCPIKSTDALMLVKNIFREKEIIVLYLSYKWIWGNVEVCFSSIEIKMIAIGLL
jgi:hypothetical protein